MHKFKYFAVLLLAVLAVVPAHAKKYKWKYGERSVEVYTTGQGGGRSQIVKAWAVAKSADKAIEQAKIDAVTAALFIGIPFDPSTHGMGVSNLGPLVSAEQYHEFQTLFDDFFKKGEFMGYVSNLNSSYPTGENNMSVPGGRRVGVHLRIDYPGLRQWLQQNGVSKGLGGHFRN